MDRSLDEIIGEKPRGPPRGRAEPRPAPRRPAAPPPRGPRREEYPRDGVRKNRPDERANIDTDWVHDRYEEDRHDRGRYSRNAPEEFERVDRGARSDENGTKVRVDNLHYELTQKDLWELFERIGPVVSVKLLYDRMDRSEGTAFVTYEQPRDAREAVAEFNGCNANGQPIKLSMVPTAPSGPGGAARGTLFDRVERPARSLFDRIDGGRDSRDDSREDVGRRRRRSESPRRRDAPERVDRYVPRAPRSRSPIRRRGTPRESGRRPGQRREDSGRAPRPGRTDAEGRPIVGGRPKKTAEELDAEMEDYWGSKAKANGAAEATNGSAASAPAPVAAVADDDIDMIE